MKCSQGCKEVMVVTEHEDGPPTFVCQECGYEVPEGWPIQNQEGD